MLDQILARLLAGVSSQHLLAVLLAATGAVLLGLAAVRQHGAVQDAVGLEGGSARQSLQSFGRMVLRPAWLLGILQGFIGGGMHIVALTLAPIALVQPIGVIAVPVTGVASAIKHRLRPSPRQITGTLVSLASVSTMTAVLLGPSALGVVIRPSVPSVIVTVAVAIGIALAVVRSGPGTRPLIRSTALAATAAGLFGLTSVLVRTVGTILDSGVPTDDLPLFLVALSGMALTLPIGFWAMQTAYVSGSPQVVVCCMTLIDPVTAAVGGRLLLQEGAAFTPATLWAAIGCGFLAAVGVVLLSGKNPASGKVPASGKNPAPPFSEAGSGPGSTAGRARQGSPVSSGGGGVRIQGA